MKGWLGIGLLGVVTAVVIVVVRTPQADTAPALTKQAIASTKPSIRLPELPAAIPVQQPAATPAPAAEQIEAAPNEPQLNAQEAQMLIQLMADQGDPRSPALGQLKPRERASAAQLADPAQYSAFEEQQTRDQLMAFAGGVQQIPAIRERIEQAAQSGERSPSELDEARAALEQLEMLQSKLQRERPELLQGSPLQKP
jgi:glucose/arabinose dehydrogenase